MGADKIYFTVASNHSNSTQPDECPEVVPSNHVPSNEDVLPVLTKLGVEAVAKWALDGHGSIEESDVRVVHLCLSAKEKLSLCASSSPPFTPDAWCENETFRLLQLGSLFLFPAF